MEGPDAKTLFVASAMAQRCRPLRRQQSGKAEPSLVTSNGAIRGKLTKASNSDASVLRIGSGSGVTRSRSALPAISTPASAILRHSGDTPGRLGQVSLYRKILVVVPDDEDKRQAVPSIPVSEWPRTTSVFVVMVWRPVSRASIEAKWPIWTPNGLQRCVLWCCGRQSTTRK